MWSLTQNCDRKKTFHYNIIGTFSFPTQFYASESKKCESLHRKIKPEATTCDGLLIKLDIFALTNSKANN